MERFLVNKTAIVTGGTRGIGYAIAEALLDAGCSVAICARSEEATESAVNRLRARTGAKVAGFPADVGKYEDVVRFFAFVDREFGALDVLVNNAGVGKFASTEALSVEDWRAVIDTNLSGVYYCCHEAIPRFRKRGAGYAINIGSLAGKNPFAGGAAYNASKFGLNGFSEAMMLDHRQDNIRVSSIMPGSVATGFDPSGAAHADWKIAPADIAEIVMMLLKMPERTLVSRIEVRPSKPRK